MGGRVKVDEGGRKKTCWDWLSLQNICWNYELLTVWKTNPGLQERFVNFWIVEGVNNMCVWQWKSYSSLSVCQFCICQHKTARKQANDTNVAMCFLTEWPILANQIFLITWNRASHLFKNLVQKPVLMFSGCTGNWQLSTAPLHSLWRNNT